MNILVVAAHPDDEIIGMGGTILKHIARGDSVYWLIVTNISVKQGYHKDQVLKRQDEIEEVSRKVGFSGVYKLDYPTTRLSSQSLIELIPQISSIIHKISPQVIYSMNRTDAHSDHRIIFNAVSACTKSFRYPFVQQFIMYETLSETEFTPSISEMQFTPNYFVNITEFMKQKLELAQIYSSELGEHPFPRSVRNIKALATFRGGFAGVEYAEAFQIVHKIDK